MDNFFRYTRPKHWSQDPKFGSRAFFRHSSDPAQMIVSSVTLEDAGTYKCRVDFKQSPTVTNTIQLKIIEEPKKPVIMDSEGSAVMGTVGPFRYVLTNKNIQGPYKIRFPITLDGHWENIIILCFFFRKLIDIQDCTYTNST